MPGFGFGLGHGNAAKRGQLGKILAAAQQKLAPHSDWDGAAGSGYIVPPSDPVRTTAKPACRLITPPWQWYSDTELIGVVAAANDGGTLINNLGLERVIAHFEGNSVDILRPSERKFIDANGIERTYFGWWVELENDGRYGFADLYFEAVPHDATMQRRVIGPYRYAPQPSRYSHQIEVAASKAEIPNQRYKTLAAAMGYFRSLPGPINPLITLTEPVADANFSGHQFGYNLSNHEEGWVHLTATVPVVFDNSGQLPYFNILSNSMHLIGDNITFDFKSLNELTIAGGWPGHGHWLDGINITNSEGPYDLNEKRTRNKLAQLFRGTIDQLRPWFTECQFDSVFNPCNFAHLIRGNNLIDCWADLFNNAYAVINNTVQNWQYHGYRDPLDAMTVTYDGAEPTASVEISLPALYNNRVVTARWGSNSASFTLKNGSADFAANTNYTIQNIVDWINTTLAGLDSGWSASLINDSRYAVAIVKSDLDLVGAFPQTSVNGISLTLRTAFDVHGDWMQQQNTGGVPFENVYIEGNRGFDLEGQIMLLGGDSETRDFIAINNAWCMNDNSFSLGISTQFARAQSHMVYAHNTLFDQNMLFRMDVSGAFDGYSLISHNALTDIDWIGTPDTDLTIKANHLQAVGEPPAGGTGTSVGGTKQTLAINAIAGDFAPSGELLGQLRAPIIARDHTGQARSLVDAIGALRVPT